jgi:hypothetical protein
MLKRIQRRFTVVNDRYSMATTFENELSYALVCRIVLRHKERAPRIFVTFAAVAPLDCIRSGRFRKRTADVVVPIGSVLGEFRTKTAAH